MQGLGIDIGGTKTACALINEKGEFVGEVERYSTPKTTNEIFELLKNIIAKHNAPITAIATAGAVNNENTAILGSTANMAEGYNKLDFQKLSEKSEYIPSSLIEEFIRRI